MYIIGISGDCEHNSSVCLIVDGKLIYAESEERITKIKNDGSFPLKGVQYALGKIPFRQQSHIAAVGNVYLSNKSDSFENLKTKSLQLRKKCWFDLNLYSCSFFRDIDIERFDHHLCHARAAAVFSPITDGIIFVSDGQGDGVSMSAWYYKNGNLSCVWKNALSKGSMGFFYAAITEILGFKRLRDEGKVTALAASGSVNDQVLRFFHSIVKIKKGAEGNDYISISEGYLNIYDSLKPLFSEKLKKGLKGLPNKDVAATLQFFIENMICTLVEDLMFKYQSKKLLLAGGLFSNVSLNHKIAISKSVEEIYICPPMGDEGTSVGAAAELYHKMTKQEIKQTHVYLGYDANQDDIMHIVNKFPAYSYIPMKKSETLNFCKDYLIKGYPVCFCIGKGEFGPRALGNRSILLRPDDKSAKVWLNKCLGRDSVMPFAPCIRDCNLQYMVQLVDSISSTNQFMTIRYNVTKKFWEKCPGVVHIDGTARFQVVTEESNPFLWELLKLFEKETTLPALLNTSLNRHGFPIARDLNDSLEYAASSNFPLMVVNRGIIINATEIYRGMVSTG